MEPINILRSIGPDVAGILQAGGYFEKGSKKDLRYDDDTKRKIRSALEEKNHRLIERMWSDDPDLLNSLPQFSALKDNLTKTDLDRIVKEMGRGPITQRAFERKINESYLTAPSRLERIERTEKHVTGMMKDQKQARKEKQKFKTWQAGPGACPICQAMHGQKRKIGEPYSNGAYIAHAHPNCLCGEIYSVE